MPKIRFVCPQCNTEIMKFGNINTIVKCSNCDVDMHKQMPRLNGKSTVTEVVDKYINKTELENQKDVLQKRKEDYYWAVEVPRFVQSGKYSLQTQLENDWVYYNDKGQLVTRTKPPHKD